jgi:anti-sigma B factor antagonist
MELSITSEARDDARVLHVSGDLDVYTAPQLKEALDELGLGGKTVLVDLAKVHFIDSTALGVLVSSFQASRAADGEFLLVMDDPYLLKIFRITGFDTLFSIFPGIPEALAAV